jgi:hypothetical protein
MEWQVRNFPLGPTLAAAFAAFALGATGGGRSFRDIGTAGIRHQRS